MITLATNVHTSTFMGASAMDMAFDSMVMPAQTATCHSGASLVNIAHTAIDPQQLPTVIVNDITAYRENSKPSICLLIRCIIVIFIYC